MTCKNIFCIYQSEGTCSVEHVNIDACGMCTACIHPNIDKKVLEEAKRALLEKYESDF